MTYVLLFFVFAALVVLFSSFVTVQQGYVAVITVFGKYRRVLAPGLNFKIPLIEQIYRKLSIQNRSVELDFQALIRTVEGSIRGFVATKKQAEILSLRRDLVEDVKQHIDHTLESWGYHLIDLQLNDITFDEAIMTSMSRVVASNNLKAAAENEGQALLITKTKAAEAEGNAIKISASAEREAAQLRGQGVALFREEVAKGMSNAAKEMQQVNLDASMIMFSMWTESIKNFAEVGKGNVIFIDGSPEGMQNSVKQLMAMNQLDDVKKSELEHRLSEQAQRKSAQQSTK